MVPKSIGRYQIKTELGRGGMATVFLAYDPLFERDVAIKVLPPAFLHDPQFRIRFEREAKLIASLEHPSIVPVYDFGEQDGQPFIVMRFMSGGSLSERLSQGPISFEESIKIISRLATALDAAHARGIIHRDIKPGNVLFDQYGNAFLSDFGVARILQQEGGTLTGDSIIGTPAYMSPEQIQGEKSLNGKSDLYALGIMVFEMLSGAPPYKSDTPAKTMMMHLLEPVPRITALNPAIHPEVDQVLAKALAKDATDRFSTLSEFSQSLEKTLHGLANNFNGLNSEQGRTLVSGRVSTSITPATIVSPGSRKVEDIKGFKQASDSAQSKKTIRLIAIVGGISLFLISSLLISSLILQKIYFSKPIATQQEIVDLLADTKTPELQTEQVSNEVTPEQTVEPTQTIEPSTTTSPTEIAPPILGGADKIAYLLQNDIYVSNMDGSNLIRLTEDKGEKSDLQWMPDGKAIKYLLGKCVQYVELDTGKIEEITCFNFIDTMKAFEISPDGQKVAISLDNQLYIVPFKLESFKDVHIRSDLKNLTDCEEFVPHEKNFVKSVRWSNDGNLLAAVIIGVSGPGVRTDIIRVMEVSTCTEDPIILDHFPTNNRLPIKDYEKNPEIQSFGWDGVALFVLNSIIRNDGFGNLYTYNMELHKGQLEVNPILNHCCYRDPEWSPDGNQILFAFQDMTLGSESPTLFYMIPYGTMGTGLDYEPLPIPGILEQRNAPQPILRPALIP